MNPALHSARLRIRQAMAGLLWLVVGVVSAPGREQAQQLPLAEYAVKAALVFNIAKYADWPPNVFSSSNAPIVIGVLGDDPFGEVLDRVVRERVVNGRPFIIRRASGVAELRGAHLVFVSPTESYAAQECAVLEGFNVLTIGDTGQTAPFTALNFSVEGDKVVFNVDLGRAARAGVTISSKLLTFAKTVKRASGSEAR